MCKDCRRISALLTIIVVLLSLIASPAADQRKLLFVSTRTGNNEIFLANADGTDARNLTNNPASEIQPAWAPDGKKIAFDSDRSGNRDTYVMDADGSNIKQLTSDPDLEGAPTWSPDGQKIAFCRVAKGNNAEIFVMNADGSNQINLTNNPTFDADPAWSPDGKKIAFTSNRGGQGYRLYVMDTDGSSVQLLPAKESDTGWVYPAWSPDGKKIAYADGVNNDVEVFVCDADGTNKKQMTTIGGINTLAAWSADGKKIAFQHFSNPQEPGALWTMDSDGTTQNQVIPTEAPLQGGRPAWKPAGPPCLARQ